MSAITPYLHDAFQWCLRTSAEVAVLVVAIVAVQALLGKRLSPRWHYWLWLMLVARMLLPWMPESPASLFNVVPSPEPALLAPAYTLPVGVVFDEAPASEEPARFTMGDAAAGVWLLGALALLGHVAVVNLRFRRRVRRDGEAVIDSGTLGLLESCKREMGVSVPLALVSTGAVESPALLGFVRPRLLVPADLAGRLSAEELRFVFLHEMAHLKRRDILVGWLMSALQAVHWFNPLVWYGFHRMRQDRELACDALALSKLAPEETRAYGRTVLRLFEEVFHGRRVPGLAGILEDESQLKRRVRMIAVFRRRSLLWSAPAVALMAIAAATMLTRPETAQGAEEAEPKPSAAAAAETTGIPLELLEQPVSIEYEEMHLSRIAEDLERQTGVPFEIDSEAVMPEGGPAPGVERSSYASDGIVQYLRLEDVPLTSALKAMLRPMNLEYLVMPDRIVLTRPEEAHSYVVVTDSPGEGPQKVGVTISPSEEEETGALRTDTADAAPRTPERPETAQDAEEAEALDADYVLKVYPDPANSTGMAASGPSNFSAEVLEQPVTIEMEGAHLEDVARELSRMTGVDIRVDHRAVMPKGGPAAGINVSEYPSDGIVQYVNLENVPLTSALKAILRPMKLGYFVMPDHIVLTRPDGALKLVETGEPTEAAKGVVEQQKLTAEVLDAPVTIEGENKHISRIAADLERMTGTRFRVASDGVMPEEGPAEGVDPASYSTDGMVRYVRLNNVPLRDALRAILRPLGLVYVVTPDAIVFTRPEKERHTVKVMESRGEDRLEWRKEMEKALKRRISVEWGDVTVNEAVARLVIAARVNVITDDRAVEPSAKVKAARFRNKPISAVLKGLATQLGLDYKVQPGFVWISSKERLETESFEELETRYYELGTEDPAKAAEIAKAVEESAGKVVEPGTGKVLSYVECLAESGVLVVHNTPTNLEKAEKTIAAQAARH